MGDAWTRQPAIVALCLLLGGCGGYDAPLKPAASIGGAAPGAARSVSVPNIPRVRPSTSVPITTRLRLAMVPKGTTHIFWRAVEEGARCAAAALDVDLVWKGPMKENDRAAQIRLVQGFIADDVDALILAPLDRHALVAPVAEARRRDIPVVIVDSPLEGTPGEDFVALVATDNYAAGRMGAAHLSARLEPGDDVVLLRYLVGSASTEAREAGYLDVLKESGLNVLVHNRFAGPTTGEAKATALNMIDVVREAEGILCSNESTTTGMLLALRDVGLAGERVLVGFDSSPLLLSALEAGEIEALVVQDPHAMGARAVETAVRYLRGETVESRVDTGAVVRTATPAGDADAAASAGAGDEDFSALPPTGAAPVE